jgi:hypothetical protein
MRWRFVAHPEWRKRASLGRDGAKSSWSGDPYLTWRMYPGAAVSDVSRDPCGVSRREESDWLSTATPVAAPGRSVIVDGVMSAD